MCWCDDFPLIRLSVSVTVGTPSASVYVVKGSDKLFEASQQTFRIHHTPFKLPYTFSRSKKDPKSSEGCDMGFKPQFPRTVCRGITIEGEVTDDRIIFQPRFA